MYSTYQNDSRFRFNCPQISNIFKEGVPTFEKDLDSFFEQNSEKIIQEWDLVTSDDLKLLQVKLNFLSYDVRRMLTESSHYEERVKTLTTAITELEENL